MIGNVHERCQAWPGGVFPGGSATDVQQMTAGATSMMRGGSWMWGGWDPYRHYMLFYMAGDYRVTIREFYTDMQGASGCTAGIFGFRVVLAPVAP